MNDSAALHLTPQPLNSADFARFGDVIEATPDKAADAMNEARFARYDKLAQVEHDTGAPAIISIAQCQVASSLPYQITLLERHPHASQAFIPLTPFVFVVVVAPAGAAPAGADLCAFISNGDQGINYHRGTWHMPLIAFQPGHRFLVVDADEQRPNCDEIILTDAVWLEQP